MNDSLEIGSFGAEKGTGHSEKFLFELNTHRPMLPGLNHGSLTLSWGVAIPRQALLVILQQPPVLGQKSMLRRVMQPVERKTVYLSASQLGVFTQLEILTKQKIIDHE
ncbi:MAG: hypothetical protein HON53_20200 [Planctomycetaceae bacterium]|nr:hypothetical protein [Planctomycetaceae bacterium]MBT6497044.1 hypothetical protein [Planctomycetaceae bacterium]